MRRADATFCLCKYLSLKGPNAKDVWPFNDLMMSCVRKPGRPEKSSPLSAASLMTSYPGVSREDVASLSQSNSLLEGDLQGTSKLTRLPSTAHFVTQYNLSF